MISDNLVEIMMVNAAIEKFLYVFNVTLEI